MNEIEALDAMGGIAPELVNEAGESVRKVKRLPGLLIAAGFCAAVLVCTAVFAVVKPHKGPGTDAGVSIDADRKFLYPFFKYEGRIYEGCEAFPNVRDFVGETLGTIEHANIDENFPLEELEDMTGVAHGEVCAVKGVDPKLMLCMRRGSEVTVFTCSSGLRLVRGADVFEDMMHIKEAGKGISYESQASFRVGNNEVYEYAGDESLASAFIDAVCEGEWVRASDMDKEAYRWWNIYIPLESGYTAHLVYYRGGYVKLYGLDGAAVKPDPERIKPFIEYLDSEHAPDR